MKSDSNRPGPIGQRESEENFLTSNLARGNFVAGFFVSQPTQRSTCMRTARYGPRNGEAEPRTFRKKLGFFFTRGVQNGHPFKQRPEKASTASDRDFISSLL